MFVGRYQRGEEVFLTLLCVDAASLLLWNSGLHGEPSDEPVPAPVRKQVRGHLEAPGLERFVVIP